MTNSVITAAILLCIAAGVGVAQTCQRQWTDSALSQVIVEAPTADQVYRACAIGASGLRPALRRVARRRGSVSSPAAAAQVCLGKLGDDTALAQLRDELNDRINEGAIVKLANVRTTRSVSLLMGYVAQHQADASRVVDFGDAGYDPIAAIWREIAAVLPDAPQGYDTRDSSAFPTRWREWWRRRQESEVFPPLENEFPGKPLEQCLARKIELGFRDALLDLDEMDTSSAATRAFRRMAGADTTPIASLGTVRGTAQAVLAKRADHRQRERIMAELNTGQYNDAIGKLELIERLSCVGILVASLDIKNFLASTRTTLTPQTYQNEVDRYRRFVFAVLQQMVKQPPVPERAAPTPENIQRWAQWWASGPTEESLVPARGRPHE